MKKKKAEIIARVVPGFLTTKEVAAQLSVCKDTVLDRAAKLDVVPVLCAKGLRYYGGGGGVCLWTADQVKQLKEAAQGSSEGEGVKKPSETALVRQCLDTLSLYGVMAWRNNSGATKVGDRFIRFGEKGSPDIIGVLPGRGQFLGVECKIGKGRQKESQEAFQAAVESHGGRYWLVRDVTELIGLLQEWRHGR